MYNPYYALAGTTSDSGFNLTSPPTLLMLGGIGLAVGSFLFGSKYQSYLLLGGIGAAGVGGYLTFAGGAGLPTVTNKVINPADVAQGGFNNIWNFERDYGPYMLGGGILLWLISRKNASGSLGSILYLSAWAMMLLGGLGTLLNFNILGGLPKPGALLRGVAGPVAANMAVPYYPMPNVMQRPYTQIDRNVVTGKTQNGSLNPAYDKNTVFSVIGDVY